MTRAALYGLVLAGGRSRRMGHDKAQVAYHGRVQAQWAADLLSRHCERVFLSVRPDQTQLPVADWPTIVDRHTDVGPLAGIAAAQQEHPHAAWLVMACDLPFVSDQVLATLIDARDLTPFKAYRSSHDGLPEPLCAIYEPLSIPVVQSALTAGRHCPRKLIIQSGVTLLDLPEAGALDNINTPDELAGARERLGSTARP
jgi:molybdopterin-guanine dinucleotide biosynthesis protein A